MARRININNIAKSKGNVPLVCLTAYTAPVAKILDKHCDILLVGDSLGMVLYAMDSTLSVTLDMMINHGRAVVKSTEHAFIVVDMPFGSYQKSKKQAFANAAKIMAQTSCNAIKIEGGEPMAKTINYLAQRGIAVMAHIGLMPQQINTHGDYSARGKTEESRQQIIKDAKAVCDAGAFAVVLENVTSDLADEVTKSVSIPVIGIGASNSCDGQVLVSDDMLGLFTDFKPRFVKRYGSVAEEIERAVVDFNAEVKSRKFPADENCFI